MKQAIKRRIKSQNMHSAFRDNGKTVQNVTTHNLSNPKSHNFLQCYLEID